MHEFLQVLSLTLHDLSKLASRIGRSEKLMQLIMISSAELRAVSACKNCSQVTTLFPGSLFSASLVVGTETLVAAGHLTIYPSKTAGWVGTKVHLALRKLCSPTLPVDFSTTQILGGHVTSRNQRLCSNA